MTPLFSLSGISSQYVFFTIFRKEKGNVYSLCCRHEPLICFPKESVTARHKAVRMRADLTAKPDVYKVNVEVWTTNNCECISKQINVYLDSDLALFHVSDKYCVILNNLRIQERSWKSELNFSSTANRTLARARRGKNVSLLHSVQTASEPHSTTYQMGTGGSFPGSKAARAWSWRLISI
jgi:hypothetical protein